MGVITGCVGGTIRDVLAGVPSIIMRPEIYVTAAALASGLSLLLLWIGAGTATAALVGALAGFLLRGAAIRRSEEHTSDLQSLMRRSDADLCMKNKTRHKQQ